jgi:hypothetical protein
MFERTGIDFCCIVHCITVIIIFSAVVNAAFIRSPLNKRRNSFNDYNDGGSGVVAMVLVRG